MDSSEIYAGVSIALIAAAIIWLITHFKDLFFKPKKPIEWYNFPPQEWKFTTDGNRKTVSGFIATHLFVNRSIANLDKIEIIFDHEPEEFSFDKTCEYSQETRGNAFVITLKSMQRKEEITLRTNGTEYSSVHGIECVVFNGRKIKNQHDFKVVNHDKIVLPAWTKIIPYIAFGAWGIFLLDLISKFSQAAP